jgi:hypothetical protein
MPLVAQRPVCGRSKLGSEEKSQLGNSGTGRLPMPYCQGQRTTVDRTKAVSSLREPSPLAYRCNLITLLGMSYRENKEESKAGS